MTDRGYGLWGTLTSLVSHSCHLSLQTLDDTATVEHAARLLRGIPNILRHSVTCVRIFLGHLTMHRAC
ncbi:hypothetical protein, partial [Nereida ignava]|uniref:hypothetical protein n=1 Tax=Nereida ignava TaxID=282199 RepID=UPI001C4347DB